MSTETTTATNEVPVVPNWILALLGIIHRFTGSLRGFTKALRQDWHWNVTRPLKERTDRRHERQAQRRQAREAYFNTTETDQTDDVETSPVVTASEPEDGQDAGDTKPMESVDPAEEDDAIKGSGPPKRPRRQTSWQLRFVAAALLVGLLVTVGLLVRSYEPKNAEGQTTNETSATVKPAKNSAPGTTWRLKYMDTSGNRIIAEGVGAIRDAKTDAQAEEAAQKWLDKIKSDPRVLKAASVQFLESDVDTSTLFDKDGWATDKAVGLVARLQMKLASSRIVSDSAPEGGTNSGMDGNRVVSAQQAGISGDRRAIRIELVFKDGHKEFVWIMWRCGNFVTMKAKFPVGRTERQPRPPRQPHLAPKVWQDDPGPQGNAPVGHGPNADPGPGRQTPRPPSPPAQYTPPPPPPPSGPPANTQPDPTPPPPPAPSIGQDPPNNGRVPTQ